jgi:hypothetical protein
MAHFKILSDICMDGLRKPARNHDNLCPGRDSKWGPSKLGVISAIACDGLLDKKSYGLAEKQQACSRISISVS